jgi:hypothetical protein
MVCPTQSPFHYKEQFVVGLVVAPHKRAGELHQLRLLAIQISDNPGLPVVAELGFSLSHRALADFDPRWWFSASRHPRSPKVTQNESALYPLAQRMLFL